MWTKNFRIDAIRVDYDLFRSDARLLEIHAVHFRDNKNTGRRRQVQTFVPFEQIKIANAIPVTSHPNFRTVIFKKQGPPANKARDNTCPTETSVPLINKVRVALLYESRGATREHGIVSDIENCSCRSPQFRVYLCKPNLRRIETDELIVTDDLNFGAEFQQPFDHSFDMTSGATGLCAWSRRRPQISDSKLSAGIERSGRC